MEKTRVPKGEKYWYINTNATQTKMLVNWEIEGLLPSIDTYRFECGNYFLTEEDAIKKITQFSAILKGADVIKMPSEEERIQYEPVEDLRFRNGWMSCYNWLKSKIVK